MAGTGRGKERGDGGRMKPDRRSSLTAVRNLHFICSAWRMLPPSVISHIGNRFRAVSDNIGCRARSAIFLLHLPAPRIYAARVLFKSSGGRGLVRPLFQDIICNSLVLLILLLLRPPPSLPTHTHTHTHTHTPKTRSLLFLTTG
jgi:hypothetical protein